MSKHVKAVEASTNPFFETEEGRAVTITSTYFRNGETWARCKERKDVPLVLLDVDLEEL